MRCFGEPFGTGPDQALDCIDTPKERRPRIAPGPSCLSRDQCAWPLSQSLRLGSVSNVCSGGGEGSVHSSVSAYSFQ